MNNEFIIKYKLGNSFLESLNAGTKFRLFMVSIALMMISFDLRIIFPFFIINLMLFLTLYDKNPKLKFVIKFMIVMNIFNFFLFYLADTTIGTDLANQKTILFKITGRYVITYETIMYIITRFLKIMGSLLISFWYILSITPTHISIGLSENYIPYRYGTMVSLALRYIPEVYRDFITIREAMQMRGLELDSKKIGVIKSLKENIKILLPLMLISFEKVDVISSAMDLRGYGRQKTRTYYYFSEKTSRDKKVMIYIYFQILIIIGYMIARFYFELPGLWVI